MKNVIFRIIDKFRHDIGAKKYEDICLQTKERMSVDTLLPSADLDHYIGVPSKDTDKHTRYKIGIFHQEPYMYNMIHSLFNEFMADDKYEVCIIVSAEMNYGNHYYECARYLKQKGISYKYDFECVDETFDAVIVICVHVPPTKEQMQIRDKANFCFEIPSNEYNPNFLLSHKNTILLWRPDAIFCEKIHAEMSEGVFNVPIYATGNPKYDLIYEKCNRNLENLPNNFKKLTVNKFRKTFLYITDHIGSGMKVGPSVSFDLYARTLFDFFDHHKECCMIFRPYNAYIEENIQNDIWTSEDVRVIKEYCNAQTNIIWDEEDSDAVSLSLADAVISDVGCGITTHALPLLKPIGIPIRWDMNCSKLIGNRIEKEECYYIIESDEELKVFLEQVLLEKHEKYDGMKKRMERYVTNYDGQISIRIKNIIEGYINIC